LKGKSGNNDSQHVAHLGTSRPAVTGRRPGCGRNKHGELLCHHRLGTAKASKAGINSIQICDTELVFKPAM